MKKLNATKAVATKAVATKAVATKAVATKAVATKAVATKAVDEKAVEALYTNAGIKEFYSLTVQETAQRIASVDGSLFNAFVALVIKCNGNRGDVYAACEAAKVVDSTKRVYYGRVVEKFHAGKLALPASIGNALPAARAAKATAPAATAPAATAPAATAPAATAPAATAPAATAPAATAPAATMDKLAVQYGENADFASALFQLASRDSEVYANLASAARSFGIVFSKTAK